MEIRISKKGLKPKFNYCFTIKQMLANLFILFKLSDVWQLFLSFLNQKQQSFFIYNWGRPE